jgi:DNA polymerase-3 subunit alpha
MKYIPLHLHTTYSLQDGLSQIEQIVHRLNDLNINACAITDHGTLSGCISFLKAMLKAKKKPILGIEFYVPRLNSKLKNDENRHLDHLLLYAKNDIGWKNLVQTISLANTEEHFYYKPRLSLDYIKPDGLIVATGHWGTTLGNILLEDDWEKRGREHIELLKNKFESVWLEVQVLDTYVMPEMQIIADRIRQLGKTTNTPCIASTDAHYSFIEQAEDQRVLLCANMGNKTLDEMRKADSFHGFFNSNHFYIPSEEDLTSWGNTSEELENTVKFAEQIEEYKDILRPPMLPNFECPLDKNGVKYTQEEYLRELCREGWRTKIANVISKEQQQEYVARIKYELDIICGANLAGYFLIVKDILDYTTKHHSLVGPGRGCLGPNTNIVLENGQSKNISKITPNDRVYCSDGISRGIKAIHTYDTSEEMLAIYSNFGDVEGVMVTPDHKILAEKITRPPNFDINNKKIKTKLPPTGNLQWLRAEDLSIGDWVFTPRVKLQPQKYQNIIDLAEFSDNRRAVHNDTLCTHNIINGLTKNINRTITYPRYVKMDEDFYFLLGLFTGDGWLTNRADHLLGFAFNSNDVLSIEKFRNYCLKQQWSTMELKHKTKHLLQISIKNIHLTKFFKYIFRDYQRTSKTKHIPLDIDFTNKALTTAFIKGYISADGHKEGTNRYRLTTVSYRLANEARLLLKSINIPSSLQIEERKPDPRGYPVNTNYNIGIPVFDEKHISRTYHILQNGVLTQIRKIDTVSNIDNKVYDLTIEDSQQSNYLTSSFIVHNSVGGCLMAYLLNITQVDPIKYDLIFERFMNPARISSGAGPDIDCDIPVESRSDVINYIVNKYGKDYVSGIVTFQNLQGRSSLKTVLRAYNVPFGLMNDMTKNIYDKAKIADELQEIEDSGGNNSIILWSLNNHGDKFQEWVTVEDDKLSGPYAHRFEQAMRLEATKIGQSKHACGVVISPVPIREICPLIREKNGDLIAGFEMKDLEAIGCYKFDLLGLNLLDKLIEIGSILKS